MIEATRFWIIVQDKTRFGCSPTERVLIAMERAGAKCIPVGCRGGGCGLCRVKVLDGDYRTGKMSDAHVTDQDAVQKFSLACQLYPLSDMRVETARNPLFIR
ncbi:MAG: 2Fe-2S iron-sulfur cluster binding domain-containing protein [Alphaproteobacteria bacterium]